MARGRTHPADLIGTRAGTCACFPAGSAASYAAAASKRMPGKYEKPGEVSPRAWSVHKPIIPGSLLCRGCRLGAAADLALALQGPAGELVLLLRALPPEPRAAADGALRRRVFGQELKHDERAAVA